MLDNRLMCSFTFHFLEFYIFFGFSRENDDEKRENVNKYLKYGKTTSGEVIK